MRGSTGLIALVALAGIATACSEGDAARADATASATHPAGTAEPYRVIELRDAGSLGGRVLAPDELPGDSVVRPYNAESACGSSIVLPGVESLRGGLGDAIVWLDSIRHGKPLPASRRFEITNRRCELEPRVQAAIAGGMLNVRNTDRLTHRTRFLRAGSDSVLERVRHSDAGQVVPVETVLGRPGRVEVRSDLYPWMRAWIQVFDHPYFAVTSRDGAFSIDSIPPGTYTLYVWHERYGVKERDVRVEPRQARRVDLEY
ncbi:MAG TPA: carboxypeptidase regulatory-like domain-containing protein [Gemmatimonadaceae bacterium]|nr:carboxypeptidase regulatory-like domain-containing protein [Gemmatimonadaceae bacterium]